MRFVDSEGRGLDVGVLVDHVEHGRGVIRGVVHSAQEARIHVEFDDGSRRVLTLSPPVVNHHRIMGDEEQLQELKDALPRPHADFGR